MISLEAYRAKVGSFVSRARHIQGRNQFCGQKKSSNLFADSDFFYFVSEQYMAQHFLRAYGVVILVLILTLNLNFSALKLLKFLTDDDVESNP